MFIKIKKLTDNSKEKRGATPVETGVKFRPLHMRDVSISPDATNTADVSMDDMENAKNYGTVPAAQQQHLNVTFPKTIPELHLKHMTNSTSRKTVNTSYFNSPKHVVQGKGYGKNPKLL